MKILFVAMLLLVPFDMVFGYTESDYIAIAKEMVKQEIPDDSDNLMSGTVQIGFSGFATTNDFFSMPLDGVPSIPSIRKEAFDLYLTSISSTNNLLVNDSEDVALSMMAVEQCARMGYTNQLCALRRFVNGAEHAQRHLAIVSVVRLGGLDDDSLDFAIQVGTNDVLFTQRERNAAWRELARCVKKLRDADQLSRLRCTQVMSRIYGLHIADWTGIVSVDEILCICNESYAMSSNRYDTICRILAHPDLPGRLRVYFGDITNQFGDVAQPMLNPESKIR